jgi:hypothetical protein
VPLQNRYNRTENFVRWGMAVAHGRYKFLTVPLLKWPRNGNFTSENGGFRSKTARGRWPKATALFWC